MAFWSKGQLSIFGSSPSSSTGEQHSLLAYQIFRDEVMEGGFCQLIQNGYGGYIFDNPFAKVMRLWGVGDLSKLVYAAKKIYDSHRGDLERERTDEEFMAMYEQYEAFDELEDEFLEKEEEYTALVAAVKRCTRSINSLRSMVPLGTKRA